MTRDGQITLDQQSKNTSTDCSEYPGFTSSYRWAVIKGETGLVVPLSVEVKTKQHAMRLVSRKETLIKIKLSLADDQIGDIL